MKIDVRPISTRSSLVDMRIDFDKALPKKFDGLVGPFSPVQKFIDHHCMRTVAKYMPKNSGTFIRLMRIQTIIGSGKITVSTPYARMLYFGKVMVGPVPMVASDRDIKFRGAPLRGAFWWERWKNDGMGGLQKELDRKFGGTT